MTALIENLPGSIRVYKIIFEDAVVTIWGILFSD